MFIKWRKPEAALPQPLAFTACMAMRHVHPFGEISLHAIAKAAAFLPLDIFEKGLEAPLWNSVWHVLFAGDFFLGSHSCTKIFFDTSQKLGSPRGRGGGGGDPPPTHPPNPNPNLGLPCMGHFRGSGVRGGCAITAEAVCWLVILGVRACAPLEEGTSICG